MVATSANRHGQIRTRGCRLPVCEARLRTVANGREQVGSNYGSEGWGFQSLRARSALRPTTGRDRGNASRGLTRARMKLVDRGLRGPKMDPECSSASPTPRAPTSPQRFEAGPARSRPLPPLREPIPARVDPGALATARRHHLDLPDVATTPPRRHPRRGRPCHHRLRPCERRARRRCQGPLVHPQFPPGRIAGRPRGRARRPCNGSRPGRPRLRRRGSRSALTRRLVFPQEGRPQTASAGSR